MELTWTQVSAWEALVGACRRCRIRDVVVPSWEHLNTVYSLSLIARKTLQDAIRGRVWFVATDTGELPCPLGVPRKDERP
ncbi:hypothetical protein GA0115259_110973 [Streptomyces sp. MnatMP-M17]|nr:hypothetical protein GA0115259_110973 [Streptomyces sp. MnatMP-M17]